MPSLFFNSSRGSRPAQGRRRPESITDLAWNAAWSSLGLAFLMHIFGTIALGIASGCWDEMVPSLPPGWYRPEAPAGDAWHFAYGHYYQVREHVGSHKYGAGCLGHSQFYSLWRCIRLGRKLKSISPRRKSGSLSSAS